MAKLFECARTGFLVPGKDDDELVGNGERHFARAHPDLVAKLSAS
jgi:hypothetical protein